MRDLTMVLEEATRRITPMYFHISVDSGAPIYRERVYCYELYHQMRCLWPTDTEFYLNGELDKAAHPVLRDLGADFAKPDLLVHKPGYMSGNHAIIEVKTSEVQKTDIIKADIEKLAIFLTRVGYQRAIYLLYGYEVVRAAERVNRIAEDMSDLPQIELWLHGAPEQPATHNLSLKQTATCCQPLVAG